MGTVAERTLLCSRTPYGARLEGGGEIFSWFCKKAFWKSFSFLKTKCRTWVSSSGMHLCSSKPLFARSLAASAKELGSPAGFWGPLAACVSLTDDHLPPHTASLCQHLLSYCRSLSKYTIFFVPWCRMALPSWSSLGAVRRAAQSAALPQEEEAFPIYPVCR